MTRHSSHPRGLHPRARVLRRADLGHELTRVGPGPTLRREVVAVRRVVAVSLLAVALLLVPVLPSYAGGHGGHGGHGLGHHHGFHHGFRGRGVVIIGPGCCWGPYGYWWDYPPYYGYAPAPVIVQEPPVYVQQPALPESYWYYCPSSRAYYPSVPRCSEAWIKVPPRAQ